jgi:predicted HTH transcriptional regulator
MLSALKQATADFRDKYLRDEIKNDVGVNVGVKDNILNFLKDNPNITAKEIAVLSNKTLRTIERNLRLLKAQGIIARVGSDKSGYWQVMK